MNVVLVDPDLVQRNELVELLQRSGCSVAPFGSLSTAFQYMLGQLTEVDGVFVNDDDGARSSWLGRRLGMLSAPVPIFSYSGFDPDEGAANSTDVFRIDTVDAEKASTAELARALSHATLAAVSSRGDREG
jgi:hypothetical protein